MAWLREVALEFVAIMVQSGETALMSLIELWSIIRAMKGYPLKIVENRTVGSSKSNGIVERTIQSFPGITRTIRSLLEKDGE